MSKFIVSCAALLSVAAAVPIAVAPEGCYEVDIDYNVDRVDAGKSAASSAEDCQSSCQGFDGCLFWTYVSTQGMCYFKDNAGVDVVKANHVSGPAFCPTEPEYDLSCIEFETDYDVNQEDLKAIPSGCDETEPACIIECQDECVKHDGCTHFTLASGVCYLKESEGVVNHHLAGKTSGPAVCVQPTTPPVVTSPPTEYDLSCIEFDIDYNVNRKDLAAIVLDCDETEPSCILSCKQECIDSELSCTHFTLASGVCYLKDSTGVREHLDGKISGSIMCPDISCVEYDTDYDIDGDDLAEIDSECDQNDDECIYACMEECQADERCEYFTLAADKCYLKASHGDIKHHMAQKISGPGRC